MRNAANLRTTGRGAAAGRTFDETAIAKLAKGAKFDKATVDSLRATAKAANEAMRVLDSFTGEDFANAMEVNPDTGVVDWNKYSYVGKSVKAALDKQQALSDALTKLLNDLPANATADQQAALEEAMLQCDRRIGEIETVILELTNIAKDGLGDVDDRQQATLDRRVADLADEKALQMHDRSQAIAAFQRQLAPVLKQLDDFDAHPGQPATKAQLTTFRNRIAEARNAIASAAKSGVVRIPKAGGGTREFFVDRSFLDEAAKLLGEAETKLKKLRKSAALDLRRRFVRKDVAFPSVDLLQPKFAARLRQFGTTPEEQRKCAAVEIDVSKAKSPITVCGLYKTTAFHQAAIPDEMDYELCEKLKGLRTGPERENLLKDWADRLGGPRSQQYLNAKTRLDEAIACAERLEGEGKVYRDEDWENGDVQKRILEAELPQNLTFEFSQNPVGGTIVQAPTGNEGRTLVADYQYMMAGSLYVRDFGKWE